MARARQNWEEMELKIFRQLVEVAGSSWWESDTVLDLFNEQKDLREMQLAQAHEGYGVYRFTRDLVADQILYEIPVDAGRLKRVVRIFSQGEERPMEREERPTMEMNPNAASSADTYMPTYRVTANNIRLEPPPSFAQDDGLAIEMEQISEEFTGGSSVLPVDWPLYTESLLILDTIIACFDLEDAQGLPGQEKLPAFTRRRARFEGQWLEYIEERSFGRTYAEPFAMQE